MVQRRRVQPAALHQLRGLWNVHVFVRQLGLAVAGTMHQWHVVSCSLASSAPYDQRETMPHNQKMFWLT